MIKKQMIDFDLDKISRSGQCFRMDQIRGEEGKYAIIAFGRYLKIEQIKEEVNSYFFSCLEEEWETIWKTYFDYETNYGRIYQKVDNKDAYMREAVLFGSGIRILRQDLFETIICFIISQQNNIPRIKKCVENLCRNFGEKKQNFKEEDYYTFPTPEKLSTLTLEDMKSCGLGYRDKYILKTAQMIKDKEVDLNMLPGMGYEESKKELLKLCGVGIKVAECICLFALHHVDAFPIDTHIQAVLCCHYPEGFPFERYKGFAGILQQYAFYYDIYGGRD